MSPEIHFYHNTPDRLAAACRIATRAYLAGRRLAVRIPDPAQRNRFDHLLWVADARAFVPHVAAESPLAAETPVVFGGAGASWPHHDVLLNLGDDAPEGFDGFAMLMEVVGTDERSRTAARERWRDYKARGMAPVPHDLAAGREDA